jgi:hypothetical protein
VITHSDIAFFAAAVREFVPSVGTVSLDDFRARLDVCAPCRFRRGQACDPMDCGCKITGMAACADQRCPIGRWKTKPPGT